MKQPWNSLCRGDAGVEEESRIHLTSLRVLRSRETLLERRGLRHREAPLGLGSLAHERLGIEAAGLRVEDHAVLCTVAGIARSQKAVDDRLLVAVGERIAGNRNALR